MPVGNSYITTDRSFILESSYGEGKERSTINEKWDEHIIWEEGEIKGEPNPPIQSHWGDNDVLGEIDLGVRELAWLAYNWRLWWNSL